MNKESIEKVWEWEKGGKGENKMKRPSFHTVPFNLMALFSRTLSKDEYSPKDTLTPINDQIHTLRHMFGYHPHTFQPNPRTSPLHRSRSPQWWPHDPFRSSTYVRCAPGRRPGRIDDFLCSQSREQRRLGSRLRWDCIHAHRARAIECSKSCWRLSKGRFLWWQKEGKDDEMVYKWYHHTFYKLQD